MCGIFIQAGVVGCELVAPSKAKEDVKMSLNAYYKFPEQNYKHWFYDLVSAK